jgi:hypothetical protein
VTSLLLTAAPRHAQVDEHRSRVRAWTEAVLSRPLRVFTVSFVLVFLNMAAWSLASPLFASPDEPAHVVRAVALDHGQLIGTAVGGVSNPVTSVTVPASIADGGRYPSCFAFKIFVPASCARPLTTNTKDITAYTSAGRYPPLYYAIVGLPSLVSDSTGGVYAMRLVSAALSALFVALAFMSICLWSRRTLMLLGVLVAVTPMTLFLGGVVNPNGTEICAALCMWTAGLVLVLERADDPPRGLVIVLTVSAVMLMLSRGISPLWVALILVVLAILAGRRGVVQLLRSPSLRVAGAVVVLCAIAAVVWVALAHANDLQASHSTLPTGAGQLLPAIWSVTGYWLQQMIGVFGWLDTPAPVLTYLIWYAAIGVVVVLALSSAHARGAIALLVLVAMVVLVPIAIAYHEYNRLDLFWQGRYTLPMATGVPIMATALIDGAAVLERIRSRLTVLMCIAIGVADFAAFYTTQRRYATGLPGPLDVLHGRWGPPLGNAVMALWSLIATVALLGFVASVVHATTPADDAGEGGSAPATLTTVSVALPGSDGPPLD